MTEKTLNVGHGEIHYYIESKPENKETIVFLPGLTADHRLFDKQIEHFRDKYNILVWDAPAHAASRPFEMNFSLADKAKWLHEILVREKIERPILIGQSMGGYVSQCYFELFTATVRAFVSIDSAPLKRKYMTKPELWILKRTEMIYRPYSWKALLKAGSEGCAETEYGRALMRDMMSGYERDYYINLTCQGYRMLADAIEADLPYEIDCPALLICGEQDKAGYTKKYNKMWTKGENLPLVMIEGAGHNSNTDKPEAVNKAIEDFLEKVLG